MAGKLEGKIRIETVGIEDIRLLKKNARHMNAETMGILKKNIETDGALTSLPFCVKREGFYEVISGNHRVEAAKAVGIKKISCLVVDEREVSKDDITRIQLSHNSLSGEDDKTILAELYASIGDIDVRSLTGLDDSMFNEKDFDIATLCPKGLKTGVVNLLFMEGEADDFNESIQYLEALCKNSETYIAKYSEFDTFLQNMGYLKEKLNIKNHAALILYLITEKKEAMANAEKTE